MKKFFEEIDKEYEQPIKIKVESLIKDINKNDVKTQENENNKEDELFEILFKNPNLINKKSKIKKIVLEIIDEILLTIPKISKKNRKKYGEIYKNLKIKTFRQILAQSHFIINNLKFKENIDYHNKEIDLKQKLDCLIYRYNISRNSLHENLFKNLLIKYEKIIYLDSLSVIIDLFDHEILKILINEQLEKYNN